MIPAEEARFRPGTPLPRRNGHGLTDGGPAMDRLSHLMTAPRIVARPEAHAELDVLRQIVPGVHGCVLSDTDGLLIGHNMAGGPEPHDLAVLAAATFGLGLQCSQALRQGSFHESTIRSHLGYFTVYAVNENVLLAVLGAGGLNVARLHLEARPVVDRIANLLHVGTT